LLDRSPAGPSGHGDAGPVRPSGDPPLRPPPLPETPGRPPGHAPAAGEPAAAGSQRARLTTKWDKASGVSAVAETPDALLWRTGYFFSAAGAAAASPSPSSAFSSLAFLAFLAILTTLTLGSPKGLRPSGQRSSSCICLMRSPRVNTLR